MGWDRYECEEKRRGRDMLLLVGSFNFKYGAEQQAE
jgi:hypothetical protein